MPGNTIKALCKTSKISQAVHARLISIQMAVSQALQRHSHVWLGNRALEAIAQCMVCISPCSCCTACKSFLHLQPTSQTFCNNMLAASSALFIHKCIVILHQHLHSAAFAGQTLAAQPKMISHQQMICSRWPMSWRQASKAKALQWCGTGLWCISWLGMHTIKMVRHS